MDNRYFKFNCPALMSDGRLITTYLNNNEVNQFIAKSNNLKTSNEYRKFLQENALQIINNERNLIIKKNTCNVQNNKSCTYCCNPFE